MGGRYNSSQHSYARKSRHEIRGRLGRPQKMQEASDSQDMSQRFELVFLLRKTAEYGGGKIYTRKRASRKFPTRRACSISPSDDAERVMLRRSMRRTAAESEPDATAGQTQRPAAVVQAREGGPVSVFPRASRAGVRSFSMEEREGRKGEMKRRDAIRQGQRKRSKVAPPISNKKTM